jgi:penicillin amidase
MRPRIPRLRRRWPVILAAPIALLVVAVLALPGCLVAPPPVASVSSVDRLSRLPEQPASLLAPATIHWNEHLIPSIQAQRDDDVPYLMGLVHAHLRSAQMELIRRIATGRMSESLGPFTRSIDEGIRAVHLDRAVPEMAANLPDDTRRWIERYVQGLNEYRASITRLPADAVALNLDVREPWTVEDVLTVGRLASVDLNWGRWLTLLPLRSERGFDDFLARYQRFSAEGRPSFGPQDPTPLDALLRVGKTGSNALVVAAERSASSGAMLASDPHLGLPQPNIWFVVAYRSPAGAVAGLTIPGLPFVVVGRNESIGWTGTNMQSPSSTLYRLPEGWTPTGAREERIGVRFWGDRRATIRETELGPVITDAKVLRRLGEGDHALRWRGHLPSDEATTFLRVSRADSWASFREAFRTYAVGGQNFLYADRQGNIGQLLAWELVPAAVRGAGAGAVDPGDPAFAWTQGVPSTDLPASYNPEAGYLVSANNTPFRLDPPIVIQGNANDRLVRMAELIERRDTVTIDDLRAIQRDVFSAASLAAARAIAERTPEDASSPAAALVALLRDWDGRYAIESRGAVAYQSVMAELLEPAYEARYGPRIRRLLRSAVYTHTFVREDLESGAITPATLAEAIERAARGHDPELAWGDIHRVRLAHPFGMVPVLGSRFVFDDIPTGGSTSTIHKSAHRITGDRHATSFGANARIVCDMADPDANLVVILGGQDGFLGADRLLDQVPLWQSGAMIPLPLSAEAQAAQAAHTTALRPAGGG